MKRSVINPSKLFSSTQYGFSQIVIADPGKMVFISGQVAWDEHQNLVGPNNLAVQTQKSIDNLKVALEASGGTLKDIVILRIYIVDLKKEDGAVISEALRDNFGTVTPPASTWINVKGLANDKFLIEIEAQAVIYN